MEVEVKPVFTTDHTDDVLVPCHDGCVYCVPYCTLA